MKDILLDCSIDKFIKNGIPEEDAKILLKHLYHCIGNLNFKFILKTDNVPMKNISSPLQPEEELKP